MQVQLLVVALLGAAPCSGNSASTTPSPNTPHSGGGGGGGAAANCDNPGSSAGYEACAAHPECLCDSQVITCSNGGWVTQYSLVPGTCQAASGSTTPTGPGPSPGPHKPWTHIDPPTCEVSEHCYFNQPLADCLNAAYDEARACSKQASINDKQCRHMFASPKRETICSPRFEKALEACRTDYDRAVDACAKKPPNS